MLADSLAMAPPSFTYRDAYLPVVPGKAIAVVGIRRIEPCASWSKVLRTEIDERLHAYLAAGGFPEAQGVPLRDRRDLLRSYVDVAILRDVIERHAVSNPPPLRWQPAAAWLLGCAV